MLGAFIGCAPDVDGLYSEKTEIRYETKKTRVFMLAALSVHSRACMHTACT